MLHIWIGRAGTGKSKKILECIKEKSKQGKQILMVPEHASFQAELDLCRMCGDTVSRHAEVLSFERLCHRVLSAEGGLATVTLDAGGKILTLQKVISEIAAELTVYRRPSQKTAFLKQMLDLFDELHAYEISPELLSKKIGELDGPTRDKLDDLTLLYKLYEARLSDTGVADQMEMLQEKLEHSNYIKGKDIFIDGFSYFTAQELQVLKIMLKEAASVTIAILGERTSKEEIFELSGKTVDQLRWLAETCGVSCNIRDLNEEKVAETSALSHLERTFFGENIPYDGDCSAIRVREAEDVFSEVEQTAAEIRTLVASGACQYRDIKVAARNIEDYDNVIDAVFERYGIPMYHSRRSDIIEKPVFSLLTGVLDSIENGYEYEDMFRWLKTGLAGLSIEECDILENYVLTWQIYGSMWTQEPDWDENPDGYGAPRGEKQQSDLGEVNRLRRQVCDPLNRLSEALKSCKEAKGKVEALYSFLDDIGLQESLEKRMEEQANNQDGQAMEETAQLWGILCDVLDQFVEILGNDQMELGEFSRLLRLALSQYSVATIPVSLDQVSVSSITRNDRHTAKYLFLLGANDHVIPSTEGNKGILNDDDRDALDDIGVKLAPSGDSRFNLELQNLYAALAQATHQLVVSYPVADVSGSELRPSFVIERLKNLFPGLKIEKEQLDKRYRLTAPIPALEMAGQHPESDLWKHLKTNDAFSEKMTAMERATTMKRGALSRGAVRALYGDRIAMSASRLERLRSCHFAYFMEYGLRAKTREPASFDAPQIGTFLHYLLEHVTRDVLAQGGFAEVTEEKLHALVQQYIDRYVQDELNGLQNRSARFQYLFRRLQNTAYAVVDQVAEEMRHSDFVPLEFELSFGENGALPAVVISEPDVELRIGGKVDRIDGWVKDDKLYLRVVDYKSGRKVFDLSAVRMGLDIQMLLYLFTLQKEGAAHFGKEIEPAGVLYLPARDEILSAQRNITPEMLVKEREKVLKRSGLLLADPAVLQAMEHEALKEPHYLPLRVSKDGNLSGSIASAAQLGKLGLYVDELLHQIAEEIRMGNIDADPCCHSESDSICQYCDWADACHFKDGRDSDHLRYILPVKPEDFWRTLDQKGGGDTCQN